MRRSFSRPLWRIAALPFVGYLGQTGVALALGAGQDEGLPWLAVVVVCQGGRDVQIHLIEKDQAGPLVQRLFDALERQSGSVSNFNKMLAHKPDVLRAFNQLSGAIWAEGTLVPKLKELAYLRVSILNGCAY